MYFADFSECDICIAVINRIAASNCFSSIGIFNYGLIFRYLFRVANDAVGPFPTYAVVSDYYFAAYYVIAYNISSVYIRNMISIYDK